MMKIIRKMVDKTRSPVDCEGVTFAFLGDSVTQGCFEIYKKQNGDIETVFDKRHSYEMYVLEILNTLFPMVTVNIINAGISGDHAARGLSRVDAHVIRHQPDLTVVCYGLNDCSDKGDSVGAYVKAMEGIFEKLKDDGGEIIYMTPNMMNTRISDHITDEAILKIAEHTAHLQNKGIFDAHIEAAKQLCRAKNIPICDCYALWKKLASCGVDTTELLSNKINHPSREMNKMFAYELVKTMFAYD